MSTELLSTHSGSLRELGAAQCVVYSPVVETPESVGYSLSELNKSFVWAECRFPLERRVQPHVLTCSGVEERVEESTGHLFQLGTKLQRNLIITQNNLVLKEKFQNYPLANFIVRFFLNPAIYLGLKHLTYEDLQEIQNFIDIVFEEGHTSPEDLVHPDARDQMRQATARYNQSRINRLLRRSSELVRDTFNEKMRATNGGFETLVCGELLLTPFLESTLKVILNSVLEQIKDEMSVPSFGGHEEECDEYQAGARRNQALIDHLNSSAAKRIFQTHYRAQFLGYQDLTEVDLENVRALAELESVHGQVAGAWSQFGSILKTNTFSAHDERLDLFAQEALSLSLRFQARYARLNQLVRVQQMTLQWKVQLTNERMLIESIQQGHTEGRITEQYLREINAKAEALGRDRKELLEERLKEIHASLPEVEQEILIAQREVTDAQRALIPHMIWARVSNYQLLISYTSSHTNMDIEKLLTPTRELRTISFKLDYLQKILESPKEIDQIDEAFFSSTADCMAFRGRVRSALISKSGETVDSILRATRKRADELLKAADPEYGRIQEACKVSPLIRYRLRSADERIFAKIERDQEGDWKKDQMIFLDFTKPSGLAETIDQTIGTNLGNRLSDEDMQLVYSNILSGQVSPEVRAAIAQRGDGVLWLRYSGGQLTVSDHKHGNVQIYSTLVSSFASTVEDVAARGSLSVERANKGRDERMVWGAHGQAGRSRACTRLGLLTYMKDYMRRVLNGEDIDPNHFEHITEMMYGIRRSQAARVQHDPTVSDLFRILRRSSRALYDAIFERRAIDDFVEFTGDKVIRIIPWNREVGAADELVGAVRSLGSSHDDIPDILERMAKELIARGKFGEEYEAYTETQLALNKFLLRCPLSFRNLAARREHYLEIWRPGLVSAVIPAMVTVYDGAFHYLTIMRMVQKSYYLSQKKRLKYFEGISDDGLSKLMIGLSMKLSVQDLASYRTKSKTIARGLPPGKDFFLLACESRRMERVTSEIGFASSSRMYQRRKDAGFNDKRLKTKFFKPIPAHLIPQGQVFCYQKIMFADPSIQTRQERREQFMKECSERRARRDFRHDGPLRPSSAPFPESESDRRPQTPPEAMRVERSGDRPSSVPTIQRFSSEPAKGLPAPVARRRPLTLPGHSRADSPSQQDSPPSVPSLASSEDLAEHLGSIVRFSNLSRTKESPSSTPSDDGASRPLLEQQHSPGYVPSPTPPDESQALLST